VPPSQPAPAPFKGDLDWPVAGTVAGGFGRQINRRFHTSVVSNGIRIAAEAETPVTAVHEGVVAYATTFTGFGKLVIIDHGLVTFSLYGYLATSTSSPASASCRASGWAAWAHRSRRTVAVLRIADRR